MMTPDVRASSRRGRYCFQALASDAAGRSKHRAELKEKAPVCTGAFLIWQALEKPQWRLASG
jgi:hypothetical protein